MKIDPNTSKNNHNCGNTLGYRLLVRSAPIEGEAGYGYTQRVALENGYANARELCSAVLAQSAAEPWEQLLLRLNAIDSETDQLLGPLPNYWGIRDHSLSIALPEYNQKWLRWCPLCLQEKSYVRHAWTIKLCTCCIKHQCKLLETCERCGSKQDLAHSNLVHCANCGHSLSKASFAFEDLEILNLHQLIFNSSHTSNTVKIPRLALSDWLRLIRYLGQFNEYQQPKRPGQISSLHELVEAQRCVGNAAKLLFDWPINFVALLHAIQSQQETKPSIRNSFGSIYHVIYFNLKESSFQFLRDAFEDYLKSHWWGHICKRNRGFQTKTRAEHPKLTIAQAAKKSAIKPSLIKQLSLLGFLEVARADLASGRTIRAINENDLPEVAKLVSNSKTLGEAAKYLSISESRLRFLAQANVITPLISKPELSAANWLFTEHQLQQLFFKCQSGTSNQLVSFVQVMKNWRLNRQEFLSLVRAIINSELSVYGYWNESIPIGLISFDRVELKPWLSNYKVANSNKFSINKAAEILDIKQEVAYQLVRNGLLTSVSNSNNTKSIPKDALIIFEKNYISLAKLKSRTDWKEKLSFMVKTIAPVSGPSIDGGRQYFFKKADFDVDLETNT